MPRKVLHAEMTPQEFRQAVAECPVAYVPLGTLEWHGEHLPLGADGIQSQGFFEALAREVGGVVLPMLYLGPDRRRFVDGEAFYGMDVARPQLPDREYDTQKLAGSAYWVPDGVFVQMLDCIVANLARQGFRVIVGHGHGPSGQAFHARVDRWRDEYGVICFNCWGSPGDRAGRGIQVDHAAANETSLTWALRPDLVRMDRLPAEGPLVAVGGRDPRVHASEEFGREVIAENVERMAGKVREALAEAGQG